MEDFFSLVASNWEVWAGAAGVIIASGWAIAKAIIKLTPNTKDDAFVEKADPFVDKAVDVLDGRDDRS